MRLTVRLLLRPTKEQAEVLRETLRQHTECFNAVCAYGWTNKEKNRVKLHHATYRSLRQQFPQLPSTIVIAARVRATEALKSAFTKAKQGKNVSQPQSKMCPIRYESRMYRIYLQQGYVSLSSTAGRLKVPFDIYPYALNLFKQAKEIDSADLKYRHGQFWLHVSIQLPDVEVIPNGKIVGVDLGVTRPAVLSNNRFLGEKWWKGKEWEYFQLRRRLQRKGTRSAKRHLRKLAVRENSFRRYCDHVLSRRIVDAVEPGTVIVLEDLTKIRDRVKFHDKETRRNFHNWSFRRLIAYITYKAARKGCKVVLVDPAYTSQRCSRCGYIDPNNRRSQAVFKCKACGFELNADLNAARNLVWKYSLLSAAELSRVGCAVQPYVPAGGNESGSQ